MTNAEKPNRSKEDQDALIAFQLRARLSHHLDFNRHLWPVMAGLGWKYSTSNSTYCAPCGIWMGNSKECTERLDEFALGFCDAFGYPSSNGTIGSDVQSCRDDVNAFKGVGNKISNDDLEYDKVTNKKLKEARNDLLEAVFDRMNNTEQNLKSRRGGSSASSESKDGKKNFPESCNENADTGQQLFSLDDDTPIDGSEWKDTKEEDTTNKGNTGTNYDNPDRSATANERGTEQYFETTKIRRGKRKRQSSLIRSKPAPPPPPSLLVGNAANDTSSADKIENQKNGDKEIDNKNKTRENEIQPAVVSQEMRLIYESSKLMWPNPKDCVSAIQTNAEKNNDLNQIETRASRNSKKRSEGHRQEIINENYDYVAREEKLKEHFSEWTFLLSTHHSILLYGFGSKRVLLEEFCDSSLRKVGNVLTLNGYDKDIDINQILDLFVEVFLDGVEPPPLSSSSLSLSLSMTGSDGSGNFGIVHRAAAISRQTASLRRHLRPIYLVINNIDGIKLQNRIAQDAIAALVVNSHVATENGHCSFQENGDVEDKGMPYDNFNMNSRVIRLVASVDNVNAAALLWEMEALTNFSWIWKSANTHRPYYDEVKFGVVDKTRKIKTTQGKGIDTAFMDRVLESIAPLHTEILQELAKLQLEVGKKKCNGVPSKSSSSQSSLPDFVEYATWKEKCSKGMLISKETDLRNMMKELIDHGMIELKKNDKTYEEMVCIPVGNKAKLKEILNLGKK